MLEQTRDKTNYYNTITSGVIRAVMGPRRHIFDLLLQAGSDGLPKPRLSQALNQYYPDKPGLSLSYLLHGTSLPYPGFVTTSNSMVRQPTLYATQVAEQFLQPAIPIADKFFQENPGSLLTPLQKSSNSLLTKITLLHVIHQGIPIYTSGDKILINNVQRLYQNAYITNPNEPQLTENGYLVLTNFLQPILKTLSEAGVANVTEESYKGMQTVMKGRRTRAEVMIP